MIAKGMYHFRQAGNNFTTGRDGGSAGYRAFLLVECTGCPKAGWLWWTVSGSMPDNWPVI